jgi:hypothetical protein
MESDGAARSKRECYPKGVKSLRRHVGAVSVSHEPGHTFALLVGNR